MPLIARPATPSAAPSAAPAAARPPRPGRASRAALIGALAVSAVLAGAWTRAGRAPGTADLAGDWTVDLRPTPDAPAYLRPMRLAVAADHTVSGAFYESPIVAGRADAGKGRACFAVTTRDGSGAYQTSGCLVGDRIEGQTWAEGRGFLLTWTATRAPAQPPK